MTEDEAMQLIKEHFGVDIKSIVAQECLSNQEWVVNVEYPLDTEGEYLKEVLEENSFEFETSLFINHLKIRGVITTDMVVVDCTW